MESIILLGSGGHSKSIIDSIERSKEYRVMGFIEKEKTDDTYYRGYKVIGNDSQLLDFYNLGIKNAFIAIGFMGKERIRNKLYNNLSKIGYTIPTIIDATAKVAKDVEIGKGVYIGKGAIVNSNSVIGNMAIINSGAIIEHDVSVGMYTHIASGGVICGGVSIGQNVLIGAGTTVIQGITIHDNAIVGAGAVVCQDIESEYLVYGVPAKIISKIEHTQWKC